MAANEEGEATKSPPTNGEQPLILITDSSSLGGRPDDNQESARKQPSGRQDEPLGYVELAAVTKPQTASDGRKRPAQTAGQQHQQQQSSGSKSSMFQKYRRKSSVLVTSLFGPTGATQRNNDAAENGTSSPAGADKPRRRLSIYEMTKTPPPETSIEKYLSERRRSSSVSAKQVLQTLEQQTTFEANYSQRQMYFRDLNAKLINQDKHLLNVVANRGHMHRHSVDIAQLPLGIAAAKAAGARRLSRAATARAARSSPASSPSSRAGAITSPSPLAAVSAKAKAPGAYRREQGATKADKEYQDDANEPRASLGVVAIEQASRRPTSLRLRKRKQSLDKRQKRSSENGEEDQDQDDDGENLDYFQDQDDYDAREAKDARGSHKKLLKSQEPRSVFTEPYDPANSSPAPDVKLGQRVAYKEYYGDEFGTVRWIGRVPQICADWTLGVEFDNAIGEGDGSLHGRRYFIAKDCFAKFLPLSAVRAVDEHVGRPEPGTMISVMAAAVRPGQMISIQRVSTVHVQHCFLNAPHRRPGDYLLAVNTRLHCQCPACGPCAHVVMPPRVQRIGPSKNATHMCQFSHYSCCQWDSVTTGGVGRKPLCAGSDAGASPATPADEPPIARSWIAGAGYLSQLKETQARLIPDEYKLGLGPHDDPALVLAAAVAAVASSPVDACDDYNYSGGGSRPESARSSRRDKHRHRHRRSIENHYLFPADDDVETLEADLDELSLARYGGNGGRGSFGSVSHHEPAGFFRGLKSRLTRARAALVARP